MDILDRFRGVIGIVVLLAIAWAISNNRKKIPWRIILWGLGLQIVFALTILKTNFGRLGFEYVLLGWVKLL